MEEKRLNAADSKPSLPFRVISCRRGILDIALVQAPRDVAKLVRALGRGGRLKHKHVVFDFDWWLLEVCEDGLRRKEQAPAPDFFLDCFVSKVCWRKLWWTSDRSFLTAFLRTHPEVSLREHSLPMTQPSAELITVAESEGVTGYFSTSNGVFFFLWKLDVQLGSLEWDFLVTDENSAESFDYEDCEYLRDRSELRVFVGDFERRVERELWGVRDFERAFGA